ncbi:hypothetical protein KFZ58_01480 [Virgibacillus sp. NKC19-16]|uniref:hypothetical protein n=1 Tax=Virgibacillus salidurans TaxID=2831673 RepID=UPI001F16E60D|nr:hypothetical protein [Virgibacillus sp. NKC19-16]UJL46660.1 hypothetical protein KFZ58_01480 [Virgibacillus sp. NKC19-16]
MRIHEKMEPTKEGKPLTASDWENVTPHENKLELWDGVAFDPSGEQRDTFCLALIYNMGLDHFIEILPDYSRKSLKELLGNGDD